MKPGPRNRETRQEPALRCECSYHGDVEALAARCVRAEAERELALEAMREWKRRALILARQVKDMGDAA